MQSRGSVTDKLLVRAVEVLIQDLGHGEHMHPVLLEHGTHCLIASNLTSVIRILEIVRADVLPKLADCLWT